MGETYYDVLGVKPDANRKEIAAAYRRRALEVHPDHNDAPDATEQFKRLSTVESILSDDRERARYDRLGHESYVRLARISGESSRDSGREDGADPSESETADAGSAENDDEAGGRRARSGNRRRSTGGANRRRNDGPFGRTNARRATSGFGGARTASGAGGIDAGVAEPETDSTFRYAVHDWTGEIDLDPRPRRLDRHALLTLSCIGLLYPVFVFASLTPIFPLPVNAFVAACTLVFVGTLLTVPRVALATFGWWGLLVPFALVELPLFDPSSPRGVLAVAFVWIPLGYAVAVRWALRP